MIFLVKEGPHPRSFFTLIDGEEGSIPSLHVSVRLEFEEGPVAVFLLGLQQREREREGSQRTGRRKRGGQSIKGAGGG